MPAHKKYFTEEEKRAAIRAQRKVQKAKNRESYLVKKKLEYVKVKSDPAKNLARLEKRRERYASNKEYCEWFKLSKGCLLCGYIECSSALTFHHKDPKEKKFEISSSYSGQSLESLKLEIEKCEVLCVNCHSRFHYDYMWVEKYPSRKNYVTNRQYADLHKCNSGCLKCNVVDPAVLQLHHRDPSEKEFALYDLYKQDFEVLLREIGKCDVLCGVCHAEHHYELKLINN